MTISSELIKKCHNILNPDIEEAQTRRVLVVKDGKKQYVTEKVYSDKLKEGYKRDKNGKQVKMTKEEQRNRSMAAKKSARNPSTIKKRSRSMKIRASLKK